MISSVKEIIKEEPDFCRLTDLAAERLGGKVLYATDDFFAEKENLIKPGRGVFITDKYTDRGKWMDGWESRRKRVPGHDWAIIRLATPGKIMGFDIDTNFFLGNHPPHASVEAIEIADDTSIKDWDSLSWNEILPKSPLDAGSRNFYACNNDDRFTHVRLHIYPDGGVARFRIYGVVDKDWSRVSSDELFDLAAAIQGGRAVACNDMFFSSMSNLIMPGRGVNMGDGWETKRNRTPGNRDWVILALATPGFIDSIIVDTCHFKGNYPDRCSIEGVLVEGQHNLMSDKLNWQEILPESKLQADAEHCFKEQIKARGPFSHVRLNIFPDGGISRMRLIGRKSI
jgi:allantoicase